MNRFYVLENRIKDVETAANEILPPSRIKKLHKIEERTGLTLDGPKMVNLNRWWQKCLIEPMEALPENHKFRKQLTDERRWNDWKNNASIIHEYMKYIGLQDEYELLCHNSWTEVEHTLNTLRGYPFYLPSVSIGEYIRNNGSIQKCYSEFLKKYCDPTAVKISETLRSQLMQTVKQLSPMELIGLQNALSGFIGHLINNNGEMMPEDEFHALIFKVQ